MNFLTLLPMAFVMIAGPQILSAVFLATSENWARNSALYVFGASLSITLVVTAAYFLLNGASDKGASSDALYVVVLVLLVVAAVKTFLGRKTSKPPKWMGTLQTASGKLSFKLGFLLLGIFPTDIITSVAVGTYLAAHGDPWIHALPFIGLTLLLLSTPALMVVALGHRAEVFLPKVRDWMNELLGRQRGRDWVLHRDNGQQSRLSSWTSPEGRERSWRPPRTPTGSTRTPH